MSNALNLAQLQAVHHTGGPSLVLAGAGSGKTRVIVHKIAHLLGQGTPAASIAAITFTNKAAAEMHERARALTGKAAAQVLICTFHSLGVRILRQDGECLGLKPQFSILDSDDVLALLKDCGGSTDVATARQWQWTISRWKNAGLDAESALAQAKDEDERVAARIMTRYHERLAAYRSVDFDDLIVLPLRLLQQHPEVRARWQAAYAHWLVDEYQDTNATQYALLQLLAGEAGRMTLVGDDDQSIYGWRGATLDNLRRLPEDYPQLKVIKLEQNYRSTAAILRAANQLIASNPKLFEKKLWSELGDGEAIQALACDHEEHEAERMAARWLALRAANPSLRWRDMAALYRANHQSRPLEQALRRAQIPYKVSGGQSFFDRAEIKDVCAWMRLLVNQDDDPAFLRAITTPKRGIGHQTLAALGTLAHGLRLSLFDGLYAHALQASVSKRAHEGLLAFGQEVNALQFAARHANTAKRAREVLDDWLKGLGYEQHLHDSEDSPQAATKRWGHVLEFCDWMAQRCQAGDDPTQAPSLLDVAQTVALASTLDERADEADVVTLSTLHAAKGLEWPHVWLAGVNEDVLPMRRDADADLPATEQATRLEEERRLMYVGITRAKQTLVVSWQNRRKRGRDWVAGKPSRFVAEMALTQNQPTIDPRERLRALRAEFAQLKAEGAASS